MKEKTILWSTAGLTVLVSRVLAGIWGWYTVTVSPLRRALPRTATGVRDSYADMTLDYTYLLRAEMPPKDAADYMRRIGSTPHSATRAYTDDLLWLSRNEGIVHTGWWNPSSDPTTTYVVQNGRTWTCAKYESGTLFVKSWSH
jgi:hypothetical protein